MHTVAFAWVLIAIGLALIGAAALAGPDYTRWMTVPGLALGALLVVVGLRRRRQAVTPPSL